MDYQKELQKQREEYAKKLDNLFSVQPPLAKDSVKLKKLNKRKQRNLKNMNLQSYLMNRNLQKMFSPFSDTDKDAFVNAFDCYPFDSSRHGVKSWLKSVGRKLGIIKAEKKPSKQIAPPSRQRGPPSKNVEPIEIGSVTKELPKGITTPEQAIEYGRKEAEKELRKRGITITGGGGRFIPSPSSVSVKELKRQEAERRKEEEAKRKVEVKEITKAQKLAPKVKTEIPVEVSVVSSYQPKTEAEISQTKKLRWKAEPVKVIKEKYLGLMEGVTAKITKAHKFLGGLVSPALTEAESKVEKRIREYNRLNERVKNEQKQLSENIKKFNKRYIGKELPKEEYEKAIAEKEKLITKARNLEIAQKSLEEEYENLQTYEEKLKRKIPTPVKISESVLRGFITTPTGLALTGVTAITQPSEIVKGVYYGIPTAVAQKPTETISELAGGFMGATLLSAAAGGVSKAVGLSRGVKVKPKITQSVSVSEATKVGKNFWRTEGKIITKIKNPKTGKVKVVESRVISDVITSPTKSGAIKSYVESWASTLKGAEIRGVMGGSPKVKVKIEMTRARGTATFYPTQLENLFRGRAEFQISDIGKITGKQKLFSPKIKTKIKIKTGEQFEGLSDILVEKVRTGKGIRAVATPDEMIGVFGRENYYWYKSLTDIYKKGGFKISRGKEAGGLKAFIPEEYFIKYGKLKKRIFKFKKPSLKYKPETANLNTIQETLIGIQEKTAAEIASETIVKGMKKPIAKGFAKPIIVTPAALKTAQVTMQLVSPVVSVKPKLKEKERLKAIQKSLIISTTKLKQKESQKSAVKIIEGLKTAFKTPSMQKQKIVYAEKAEFAYPFTKTFLEIPRISAMNLFKFEEMRRREKRKKKPKAKLRPQLRGYQASVGAALLGFEISQEEFKKLKKESFTGLELRPVIKSNRRKNMEIKRLKQQQSVLLEPAVATAKKGSPRKSVRQINLKYAENLNKMLSYAYWDKERSKAKRIKKGTRTFEFKRIKSKPIMKYNPIRQGESRNEMLKRLQKVLI